MKRTERLQVLLEPEELSLIDDWRFKNRIPSRAAAIRELIGRSIQTDTGQVPQSPGVPASGDIGVVESRYLREGKPSFTVADATADDIPLIYVSEGFSELCEYQPSEVIGTNCRFLQGPRTNKRVVAKMRHALDNNEPVEVELINYRKSGSRYNVRVKLEPVFNGSGDVTLVVGTQTFLGEDA